MPKARHSGEKDAISYLKEDHAKMRELLDELETSPEKAVGGCEKLLQSIERELKIHTTIEEEIFYPAFREAAKKRDDRKLYFEVVEAYDVVDRVLPGLRGTEATSEEFAGKAKVLKDLVEYHLDEEETQMFPRAKTLLGGEQLLRLGVQLAKQKTLLMECVLLAALEAERPLALVFY